MEDMAELWNVVKNENKSHDCICWKLVDEVSSTENLYLI